MEDIRQINDTRWDLPLWIHSDIMSWLHDCSHEYTLSMDGAPPYRYLLSFKDEVGSMMFKMTWLNSEV